MKLLILDNYDSFTYNLVNLVGNITGHRPDVQRNNSITLEAVGAYDKILLSPGPGLPEEAGILTALVATYAPSKSILGVCLGHQAIGQVFGAGLHNLGQVCHGKATKVRQQQHDSLFDGVDTVFDAGRYHSWVVSKDNFPDCLHITAEDEEGHIMALRHKTYDVSGVQFHPESILTPAGRQLLENWLHH